MCEFASEDNMNRIDKKFKNLRAQKRKAFIAFITAGDPNLKATEDLVVAFEQSSVDIVELGVPFSDPLADGPTIQAASQRALAKGVTLKKILNTVKQIRQKSQIPICLMTYFNPIYHYGEDRFINDAKASGVDGLIIPDLPPEEAKGLIKKAKSKKLATIFFLSPTTTPDRLRSNINASSGFVYYVSLTGVTGIRKTVSHSIAREIKSAKALTKKPICVGFGISSKDQVKSVAKFADGVIVGSAIVKQIDKYSKSKAMVSEVSRFVKNLSAPLSAPHK